jgi:hypothetical protein
MGDNTYTLCVIEAENVRAWEVLMTAKKLANAFSNVTGVVEVMTPPFDQLLVTFTTEKNRTALTNLEENTTYYGLSDISNIEKRFISNDSKMLLIYIRLEPPPRTEEAKKIVDELRRVLRDTLANMSYYNATKLSIQLTGGPVMGYDWDTYYEASKPYVYLAAIIFTAVLLYLAFRKVSLIIIGILVIVVSIVLTLGFLGFFRPTLSIVSEVAILPLIFGIGVDDTIHLIHRYREELTRRTHTTTDWKIAIVAAVRYMWKPMAITSGTTTVGFGALCFAELGLLSNFGGAVAIGMIIVFLTSVLLIPVLVVISYKFKMLIIGNKIIKG